ncbi:hypothetical protein CEXT_168621 [Caerostris extrusa]|uniref:Uncharacterized protein n=1 Tax=Caerostris extrusa TaxID=172846 RepID=A0AAV4UAV6_CAEEX|nr:hypothetical protein CEXT_168621 [Caerostris extrusa]
MARKTSQTPSHPTWPLEKNGRSGNLIKLGTAASLIGGKQNRQRTRRKRPEKWLALFGGSCGLHDLAVLSHRFFFVFSSFCFLEAFSTASLSFATPSIFDYYVYYEILFVSPPKRYVLIQCRT